MSLPSSLATPSQHRFTFRCLRSNDMNDLAELSRHTYDGRDYLCARLSLWLSHPHQFACIVIVYEGIVTDEDQSNADLDSLSLTNLVAATAPQSPNTFEDALPAAASETVVGDGRSLKWTHETMIRQAPQSSPSTSASGSSSSVDDVATSSNSLLPYVGHVISLEVLALFDNGSTGFLHALRVHPLMRGFGLSSLLHARMVHLAERVYHVARVRETTSASNNISIHLGRKHKLLVTKEYDCEHFSVEYAREQLLPLVEAQLEYLGLKQSTLELTASSAAATPAADISLHRGTSADVLDLVSRYPDDSDVNLLRIYWMCYEPTEANLVHLCTESILPAGIARTATAESAAPMMSANGAKSPHFLIVSPQESIGNASSAIATTPSTIGAFSLSLTAEDHSTRFRTFSLFAPHPNSMQQPAEQLLFRSASYRQLLTHFGYQLLAASRNLDGTANETKNPEAAEFRPIERVQTSTPTWFAIAFAELQAFMHKDDTTAATSVSTSASGSTSSYMWGVHKHERMLVLEKTMSHA